VTRQRDRAWLIRFIAEPDKMLAEKEPLTMALFAAYNNVAMPNLQLNHVEIQALLTYFEEESRRVDRDRNDQGAERRQEAAEP
jgi:protein SCO1/2